MKLRTLMVAGLAAVLGGSFGHVSGDSFHCKVWDYQTWECLEYEVEGSPPDPHDPGSATWYEDCLAEATAFADAEAAQCWWNSDGSDASNSWCYNEGWQAAYDSYASSCY